MLAIWQVVHRNWNVRLYVGLCQPCSSMVSCHTVHDRKSVHLHWHSDVYDVACGGEPFCLADDCARKLGYLTRFERLFVGSPEPSGIPRQAKVILNRTATEVYGVYPLLQLHMNHSQWSTVSTLQCTGYTMRWRSLQVIHYRVLQARGCVYHRDWDRVV